MSIFFRRDNKKDVILSEGKNLFADTCDHGKKDSSGFSLRMTYDGTA